jgi:hypothetical protein
MAAEAFGTVSRVFAGTGTIVIDEAVARLHGAGERRT